MMESWMNGKGGENILLRDKIDASLGSQTVESLPGLCLDLLARQKEAWQDLRKGYESLEHVRERDLDCHGFSVRLQYNPGRIKSTTAGADGADRTRRSCFLCLKQLPEPQKGILYRNEYLILCNPMPVFSAHLIAAHVEHRDQTIAGNMGIFLRLTEDFGPGWTILYNGPQCGASAPDHLHFHAAPAGQMPVEADVQRKPDPVSTVPAGGILLYRLKDMGRAVVVLEGAEPAVLERTFHRFLTALKSVLRIEEEPMLNMAGSFAEAKWRLLIFPRRKHRPGAFFRKGEGRIVVSPGVIDMAGLVITPVEGDFHRLDAAAVRAIFGEVALEEEAVDRAVTALGKME